MKKIHMLLIGFVLALIGACAPQDDTLAASRMLPAKISVTGKTYSNLKYFVDKNKFGRMTRQNDGSYNASLSVTAGTHSLKFVGDTRNVSYDLIVKVNDFRVCQRSADLLTFAMPITADQACPDLLVEEIKTGMHLASQETEIPPFPDQGSYDQLIRKQLPFVIVDVECLGLLGCTDKLHELKSGGARILIYVNPQECMLGSNINDRPFQKSLCEWAHANAESWFLKDASGNPVILWHVPAMESLDLSSHAPKVNDQTWTQYFINYYLQILSQHADVVDGILLDNAKAFISYESSVVLRDSVTGAILNPFETDDAWRSGYRNMLTYLHDQVKNYYPQLTAEKEFLTAIVSKQSDFSDLADIVIFESPFNSSVGTLINEFHPFAVVDQYLRMAAKSRLMIVEHCIADNNECQKSFYPKDYGRETGYALTLLADNSMYVFDQSGPLSHGGFSDDPIYQLSGKVSSDVQYPYVSKFTQAEKQTLTNAQSITIHNVRKGDVIRYSYRINGSYGSNSLHHSDETAMELSQHTRWVDGTVNGFANNDGDFVITFTGQGSADVWDIMHLDPTQTETDFMFCREYEHVKACYNPSATETRSTTFAGRTIEVPPMQGRVQSK